MGFCLSLVMGAVPYVVRIYPTITILRMCTYAYYLPQWYHSLISIHFVLSSLGTLCLYSKVAFVAWKKSNKVAPPIQNIEHNRRHDTQKRITKLMTSVVLVHILSYIPAAVYTLSPPMPAPLADAIINFIVFTPWYVSPVINPFPYACSNQNIQIAVKKLFCIKCSHAQERDHTSKITRV